MQTRTSVTEKKKGGIAEVFQLRFMVRETIRGVTDVIWNGIFNNANLYPSNGAIVTCIQKKGFI